MKHLHPGKTELEVRVLAYRFTAIPRPAGLTLTYTGTFNSLEDERSSANLTAGEGLAKPKGITARRCLKEPCPRPSFCPSYRKST